MGTLRALEGKYQCRVSPTMLDRVPGTGVIQKGLISLQKKEPKSLLGMSRAAAHKD